MLIEDKCVSKTASALLGQSNYGINHPKSVRFRKMTLSLSSVHTSEINETDRIHKEAEI